MGSSTLQNTKRSPVLTRRHFLGAAGAGAGLLIVNPAFAMLPPEIPRSLTFTNLHTGETLKNCAYWCDGAYATDALADIAKVLRDHRTGEVHLIDNTLLDLLHALHSKLEVNKPFHVISGYRSPASNAKLAAASSGVAKRSLHMDAKAIDIRVPGVDLKHVHKAAKAMQAGGVGFYSASNFVHVDVGRVRYW